MHYRFTAGVSSVFLVALSASSALAAPDAAEPPPAGAEPPPAAAAPLPAARSDHDAPPPVNSPGLPPGGIISQAGIGGDVSYGRAGVLELGGSAGFTFASDYRNINVSPTVGWFIADNLELSAILGISNIKADGDSSTLWSLIAEPSYHLPLNPQMFGFAGLGIGASHVSGRGTGFAVAPRIGMNFMVGRSGILTPALSYQYTTSGSDNNSDSDSGTTMVTLTSAVQFNLGYTAMW